MTMEKREIKFRAWDAQENKMNTIGCIGDGSGSQLLVIEWQGGLTLANAFGIYDGTNPTFDKPVTERFKLMQYSGLKDRNGIEIFEGDIVKYDHEDGPVIAEVVYKDSDDETMWISGLAFKFLARSEWDESETNFDIRIIGNRFENPSLLNP